MRATLAMLNVCVTLAAPRRATYAPPSSDAAIGPSHPAGSRGEYDVSTSPSEAFAQNAADDAQTSKTRSCFFTAGLQRKSRSSSLTQFAREIIRHISSRVRFTDEPSATSPPVRRRARRAGRIRRGPGEDAALRVPHRRDLARPAKGERRLLRHREQRDVRS